MVLFEMWAIHWARQYKILTACFASLRMTRGDAVLGMTWRGLGMTHTCHSRSGATGILCAVCMEIGFRFIWRCSLRLRRVLRTLAMTWGGGFSTGMRCRFIGRRPYKILTACSASLRMTRGDAVLGMTWRGLGMTHTCHSRSGATGILCAVCMEIGFRFIWRCSLRLRRVLRTLAMTWGGGFSTGMRCRFIGRRPYKILTACSASLRMTQRS